MVWGTGLRSLDKGDLSCHSMIMRLKTFALIVLAFSFFFVGGVRAEEVVDTDVAEVVIEEVSVPNPESSFFGLQVAWMKISDNIQVWLARTDEKKTDLEVAFAEKEAILMDRIVLASESNPDLAEALEGQLSRLDDRNEERLERIDTRISGFKSQDDGVGEKMGEWQAEIQTRREAVEQKKNEIQERVKNMGDDGQLKIQDQLKDGTSDGQQVGPGDGGGTGVGTGGQTQDVEVSSGGSVQRSGGR